MRRARQKFDFFSHRGVVFHNANVSAESAQVVIQQYEVLKKRINFLVCELVLQHHYIWAIFSRQSMRANFHSDFTID